MHARPQPLDGHPAPRRLMLATAACCVVATAAVFLLPVVQFAYHGPGFHIALETAASLTAALAALLFYGRLRLVPSRSGWALVYALGVSAAVNLLLSVVPAIAAGPEPGGFSQWAAMLGRLVAGAAFAYAAFATRPQLGRRRGWSIAGAVAATVAIVAAAVVLALPALPSAAAVGVDTASRILAAHPLVLTAQIVGVTLFAAAAFGFSRKARLSGDGLMQWLAAGSLLAAFSRLHYAFYPSLYADWVYTGDVLRLGFYVMLSAAAVAEIRRYWQGLADAAAERERRRLARDLHDGVAQELAYIAAHAQGLQRHADAAGEARALVGAAHRALEESRRAIAALSREVDEPLDVSLAKAAEDAADRVGTSVRLDLDPDAAVDAAAREALIRITGEAIANAGRHSRTDKVHVKLRAGRSVVLTIEDHGVGFDIDAPAPDRFGLVSMRERAAAIGAHLKIISSPDRGTTVEVKLQ